MGGKSTRGRQITTQEYPDSTERKSDTTFKKKTNEQ